MNGDLSHNGLRYRVGEFQLDTKDYMLRRNDEAVAITPKMCDVLLLLVQNPGRVLTKDELLQAAWPDSIVEESNLAVTIGHLRKALGDDAHSPRYIQTVARVGYRLVADVEKLPLSGAESVSKNLAAPVRPYVLISLTGILTLSLVGLAFVWFQGAKTRVSGQGGQNLTRSGNVTVSAVAPDGRALVFAQKDEAGESLWKVDLLTGERTQLLAASPIEFVALAVSPNSDFAYYSVFATNTVNSNASRIGLQAGSSPEPLPEIETDSSVTFSPDGKKFAFTESHSALNETTLRLADADGTNPTTLVSLKGDKRTFPIFRSSPIAWSPDGEVIACSVQEKDGDDSFFRIVLVSPRDASERYLGERHWGYVENIVWKDNAHLAVTNAERYSWPREIFLIARDTGEVTKVGTDLRNPSWLSAANGKLFAVENEISSSIHIVDFPTDSNKPLTKQVFHEPGVTQEIAWPRDDTIFYNSWASGSNEIWHINPDGTEPRRLTNESQLTYGFAVSPTDGSIVFAGARKKASGLFVADSNGENIRPLSDGGEDYRPRFLPDGKSVVFQRGSLIKPTLWRASLSDASESVKQLTGYLAVQPSVSPDGKMIAYQFMDFEGKDRAWRLGLMDSTSGKLINKIDFPFPVTERTIAWRSTDGYLTIVVEMGNSLTFLLLSPIDGSYRSIADVTADKKISSFAWSPSGDRLAFSTNETSSDAVVVAEN